MKKNNNNNNNTATTTSTVQRRITGKQLWEQRYRELLVYHQTKGHCHVKAKEDPNLASWKRTQQQNKEKLSTEQIDKLNVITFPWTLEESQQQEKDVKWEEMFQQLCRFKLKHGHCVPMRKTELGNWVKYQRMSKDPAKCYNWLSPLSEEQVKKTQ